jgi:hypothetical protein
MTTRTRYAVLVSLLVMGVGVGTGLVAYYVGLPAAPLSGAGPAELQFVPRDSAVVAYADVRQIMASGLSERVLRASQESGWRDFENHTGINIKTDIDYVVGSLEADTGDPSVARSGMMLARGTFNEVKIESLMREHGARLEMYKGKRLSIARDSASTAVAKPATAQEFAVSFLKPGLVATGTAALVRRAVDLETSGEAVTKNDEVMTLIKSVESGTAWAVGRFDALRAATSVPQAINQLPAITWFSASGRFNDGINGVVRAETRDEASANNLRDVIRGFLALAKLQAASKPELESLMQSLELGGTGKTVALSFQVPGQAFDLIGGGAPSSDKR